MHRPQTNGIHHLGLTVSKLEASADFFKNLLGWHEVKRREDYPAIFVSDGTVMLTLWAVKDPPPAPFDKNHNVGLHHVALKIDEKDSLQALHDKLKHASVPIEFAPELLGSGPAMHMMCYDPSGIRVELIWPGPPA